MDGLTERGQAVGGMPAAGPGLGWELRALFDALGIVAVSQQQSAARLQRIEESLHRIEENMATQDDVNAATAELQAARATMDQALQVIQGQAPADDTAALVQATADATASQQALAAALPAPADGSQVAP